jgi:surface polysaccharide O-acyltransferase-like enzyme
VGPLRVVRSANRMLDAMVADTPGRRDRYVDLLRVVAIGVVVLWHWCLSIPHWTGDHWAMPNPIYAVPGGWLATWLLQIMPVFFIVGGYANATAWARDPAGFYRSRLRRLLVPTAVFLAVWVGFELVAHVAVPDYPGVLSYGRILITPLWFLGAYLWVVLLTPLTTTAHARAPWLTLGGLAVVVAAADLGRFGAGIAGLGLVNSALVWVLIHQLGYFLRELPVDRWFPGMVLVAAGGLGLTVLTTLDAYSRSMVATADEPGNIWPTTGAIALVAVLQLGVIQLLRAPVTRWLRRPPVWKAVVALNSVVLTIFLWHMTALLVVLAGLRALGLEPPATPTAGWWAQRPFWLIAPSVVLAVLLVGFGRFERRVPVGRGLRIVGRMADGRTDRPGKGTPP